MGGWTFTKSICRSTLPVLSPQCYEVDSTTSLGFCAVRGHRMVQHIVPSSQVMSSLIVPIRIIRLGEELRGTYWHLQMVATREAQQSRQNPDYIIRISQAVKSVNMSPHFYSRWSSCRRSSRQICDWSPVTTSRWEHELHHRAMTPLVVWYRNNMK